MTHNQRKFLRSLELKKNRKIHQSFLIEGEKIVAEALSTSIAIQQVFATEKFIDTYSSLLQKSNAKIVVSTPNQLAESGQLKSNNAAIAVLPIQENPIPTQLKGLNLLLEDINDPGNLGTIIRIADWYGIKHIFCSLNTVDVYNPKTISATMGSFLRVQVHYGDPLEFLQLAKNNAFGAFLNGTNVHQSDLPKDALLVIGSESHGISEDLEKYIKNRLTIPRFGEAESLNAAVATAIICDNWYRR